MTFELDTSGAVHFPDEMTHGRIRGGYRTWPDLSPFVQGYARAGLTELHGRLQAGQSKPLNSRLITFDALAPETLQRFIEDCNKVTGGNRLTGEGAAEWDYVDGQTLWLENPQTLYLNDAGKVSVREGV